MGERGINPKRWFYQLREDIADRCPEVLAGAASEQWLNAELFRTVARDLGPKLTACPEVRKCDIMVARVSDGLLRWKNPIAIVEVKLVYRSYSPGKIRSYVRALLSQMSRGKRTAKQCYGFLYAVHNVWPESSDWPTFDDFKQRVRDVLFDELRSVPDIDLAKPTLETVVAKRTLYVGGVPVTIAMAGQYLVAR